MSRCGSRTSRRCMRSIPTRAGDGEGLHRALAQWPNRRVRFDGVPHYDQGKYRHQGRAGAAGCGDHQARARRCGRAAGARLREAGAVIFSKTTMPDYGMLSSGCRASIPSPAIRGILAKIPAAPAPVRAPRLLRATVRCISAPTSAARCGCRRAGAFCCAEAESRAYSDRSPYVAASPVR